MRFATAAEAACDADFADSLRQTLRLWGIDVRGVDLVPRAAFHEQVRRIAPQLRELDGLHVDDVHLDIPAVGDSIWSLIESLEIILHDGEAVQNKVVSGTKTPHHILPDLLFPIDRAYTQKFFQWANPEFQYHPEECFQFAYRKIAVVAGTVKPAQYVSRGWNSSRTKVLDNAIVALCRLKGLAADNQKQQAPRAATWRSGNDLAGSVNLPADPRRRLEKPTTQGQYANKDRLGDDAPPGSHFQPEPGITRTNSGDNALPLQTIHTLSHRKPFAYKHVYGGEIIVYPSGDDGESQDKYVLVITSFEQRLIREHLQRVGMALIGASRDNPPDGSLGQLLKRNGLTPQHLSYHSAILVHEGFCMVALRGKGVALSLITDRLP